MNDLRIEKERLTNKYSKLIDFDLELARRQNEINRLQRGIKEFNRKSSSGGSTESEEK